MIRNWVGSCLVLAACCGLWGCAGMREGAPPDTAFDRPFILYWASDPETLTHITHVTPQVGLEAEDEKNPAYVQDAWLARGVMPLKWKGGWCYKDRTEDEFVSDFCGAADAGYVGIAVDEWGGGDAEFDAKLGRALVRTKEARPDLFVAVWCFGTFRPRQAEWLRDGADVVMVERYFGGADPSRYPGRFAGPIRVAREAGILHKTVFALGMNDRAKQKEHDKLGEWANTPEELEAQMRWIRENAPEMPGISFFSPRCSPEMLKLSDELAGELWGSKR
ncbi:MAG: hypothetical protein GY851_11850 [bacterium]|nr:hypothetical protein [bacterium]